MNRNAYRIIFNKKRGQAMAVAESASADGKTAGTTDGRKTAGTVRRATLRPLGLALAWAFGAAALVPAANAQVVAYKAAPGTLRPTILPAGNGVPLINVQTPSAAGVSRNQYERLDVSSAGAIFNNSRTDVVTELGGWVEGNPWLARGTASVILNEVFSAHPSQLNGYLEVAGDRAQLVIANPAGVTCDGCGFLNAHRVTLTTGSPIVDGGHLDGYRVDGGSIRIQGDGMDASQTDYTDLIARAVEVNAGLWAQNLRVTAGSNAVDADHTAATPLAGSGERPAFAIDVARLGGMYAGKIVLVGTEAGVGVRNEGTLAAAAGDAVVTADGQLINRGAMLAGEHALVVKARGMDNSGTLSGETQVALSSQGDVVNRGLLHAGEELRLDVAGALVNRQGMIDGQRLDIRSVALDNEGGTLRQSGAQALRIEAAAFDNGAGGFVGNLPARPDDGASGTPSGNTGAAATGIVDVPAAAGAAPVGVAAAVPLVLADGSIVVQARLANTGSLAASGRVALSATHVLDNAGTLTLDRIAMSGESFRNRGDIAVDQIAIDATTIDNSGGQLNVARQFSAASRDFLNVQGVLRYLGTDAVVLAPEARLDNRGGQIASNGIDLALSAPAIDNTGGRIEHAGGGTLTLAAERFDGGSGQIGSLGTLVLDAGVVNLDNALTQGNTLNITADSLSNRGGSIVQNGTAHGTIAVAGRFDNTAGTLASAASLVLSAGELDNRGGGLIAVDGSLSLTAAGGLANDGGTISAQDDLVARIAGALGNAGGRIVAGENLLLAAAGAIDNAGGILGAVAGNADITAGGHLDNTGGRIEAAADATLSSHGLTNVDGTVLGRTLDIDTRTQDLDNTRGQLVAETRLTIASGELDNAAGLIQAGTDLDIDTHAQALINRDAGSILAQGDITLKAGEVDNSNGTLGAGGTLNIAADTLANRSGRITQNGATPGAIAVAGRLDNTAGTLASAASLDLSAGEVDNRDGGRIIADGSLSLTTAIGGLANDGGTISAQNDLAADIAGALGNAGGRIVAGENLLLAAAGVIGNAGGTLGAVAGKADIAAGGHLDNAGGRIEAAAELALSSQGLSNVDGTMLGRTLDIDTRTGALDNTRGQLVAETRLAVASGRLDSTGGLIQAGTHLDIDTHAQALINRDAGSILAQGDIALQAGEVDNDSGTLGAGGTLTLAAQSLGNRYGRIVQNGAAPGAIAVAGRLDNTAGTLASAASLALSAGELDNRGSGRIVVAGSLNLTATAGPLNNGTGTISAQGSLVARIAGALGNASGQIIAGNDLDLAATGAIGNAGGTLGAIAGKADITAGGHLTNTGGRIEAATGTTLSSQGLSNAGGTVLGRTLGIDTRSGTLDNTYGRLVAETYAAVDSGRLDNTGGLIQAGSRLDLDTHGQALVNRSNGNILAQGDIVVKAGEVDNVAGLIRSGSSLSVAGQNISNRSGQLLARTGTVLAAASVLDNRGGNVQSGGNLSASAATAIDNGGGLMRAGGTLTGYTARLDNTATQAANLGIEGRILDLSVSHIDNRDGALRADDALTVRSSGTIDNRRGLMSSQGTLAVIDNSPARTLVIDNLDGTFVANRELSLRAGRVSGDGRLLSNGDLALDQVADIVNTGEIATAGDIRLSTAGKLTNSGTVEAGDTLTLQAATLINEASGTLTGSALDVSVSGTLSNRGLINGEETRIQAGTLDNLGSGRIYGDHLAIAAGTLNNFVEGGTAPVIAARERLDLGVGMLNNRDEALIFSAGDISIGRNLDANRRATGQAGMILNHAATIEALGNVFINAGQLFNTNAGITVTQVTDAPVWYDQFTPRGHPDILWNSADYPDAQIGNFNISGRWAGDIPFREYWRYVYAGTTTRDVVATSAPAKIVSGGNMTLLGNVTNSDSQILAGNTLTLVGGDVVNFNTQGQAVTRYEGRAYYYDYDGNESCSDPGDGCYDISNIPYVRADNVGTVSLGEARIEHHTGRGPGIPLDGYVADGTTVVVAGAGAAQTGTHYGGGTARTAVAGSADTGVAAAALPGASAQTAASGTKGIADDSVARITQVAAAGNGGSGPSAMVATARTKLTLPANRLYHVQPGSTAGYLIETDPAFADYRSWLSSDYMLQQLALDPALMQKRLGDGFYEQRLITEQVAQLTGRRFLAGYASDEEQYRALMDAGLTHAEKWQLVPGIALSEAQMAALTTDIVWLVAEDVTLPDGTTERVLVPRVYARIQDGDLSSGGALLAAEHIRLDTAGDLVNSGTIAGRQTVLLDARDIRNENGTIAGQDVAVRAANDLTVLGGAIIAQNSLLATAGRDLTVESTTHSEQLGQAGNARIDRLAGLYVTGEGGTLVAAAGRDLTLIAAAVVNAGTGDTALAAGRDLTLATVEVGEHQAFSMRRDSLTRSEYGEVGSTIAAGGNLALIAGNDLTARAADVTAGGALSASAGHDLTIEAGEAEREAFAEHRRKKSGIFSSSSKLSRDTLNETTAIASTFSGDSVTLTAGNDLTVRGSVVTAQQDTALIAGRDLNIETATETHAETHYRKTKKSGLSASFTTGVNIGSSSAMQDGKFSSSTAVGSEIGGENVLLSAGRDANITGSQAIADRDLTLLAGRDVNILAAENTFTETQVSKSKGSSMMLISGVAPRQTLYGKSSASQNSQASGDNATASLLAANAGNLTIIAGTDASHAGTGRGNVTSEGADLLAQKDVRIEGNAVNLLASEANSRLDTASKSKSVNVGAALAGTVGGVITRAYDMAKAASDGTGNSRLDGAMTLKAGYDAWKAIDGAGKAMAVAADGAAATNGALGNGSAFGVSVSIGVSSSKSESHEQSHRERGTNIQAENIAITARETDVTAVGAKLQADGDITLDAKRDLNLLAAVNTDAVSSNSKGSSAGLGVTFGVGQQNGISFQIGASQMKGVTEGEAITYDNTQVTAGKTLTLKSGGDTTLRGAQVGGERVVADIGGNLAIETLQDESRYKSRQKESGFSLSICVPPICYGMSSASASASGQKVDHSYRSAQGQSGIAAGDGGFDIRVAGDTHLKGGAITSDAGAEKNRLTTRSLSFEDLTNEQHTDASSSSFSISGSADLSQSLMPSPSNGLAGQAANNLLGNLAAQSGLPDSGSETSQTLAVISPATINITGNDAASREAAETLTSRDPATANQALTDALTLQDAARVERKMQEARQNGQAAALIGQVVAGMIGDLSAAMRKPINDATRRQELDAKQAKGMLTNEERYELARLEREGMTSAQAEQTLANPEALANYENWKDGGLNKTILHGLAGLIQAKVGDGSALVGAASGALNEAMLPAMAEYLQAQGISPTSDEYKGYLQLGSALLGAGVGAVADGSGGAALGGTVAHNATTHNYLKHQEATKLVNLKQQKAQGKCDADCAQEIQRLEALDIERNQQLTACDGVSSSHCDGFRTEVRYAAAEYIRANLVNFDTRYRDERQETLDLAQGSMGGLRFGDQVAGYGQTIWEGVTSAASGIATAGKALLGDEQAKEAIKQGAGAAWGYVKNPDNWPYLLGAMTPEDREKLAQAYETGDNRIIGEMMGQSLANLPVGGAGLGTIKRVDKAISIPVFQTTKEATIAAASLGYRKINETVHNGQAVYRKGDLYITRDLDGHNGGAWKMASSIKDLENKETRLGTFDRNLNRIGK